MTCVGSVHDMSFQSIVNRLSDSLCSTAMEQFKSQWLRFYNVQITAEAETQRQHDRAVNRWGGNYYYSDYYERKVRQEYEGRFDLTIQPQLINLFNEKVRQADFIAKLNHFMTRHPWLSSLSLPEQDNLLYNYIKPIMTRELSFNERFRLRFSVAGNNVDWPIADPLFIEQRRNDYPLEILPQFYDTYASTFALTTTRLPPAPHQYKFSRIDIYRILQHHFKITIDRFAQTTMMGGQHVSRVLPVDMDEISQLDSNTKAYCRTWIIDIGEQGAPFWILWNSHLDKNSLYIPKELDNDPDFLQQLALIRRNLRVDEVIPVTNECHTQYTAISDELIWQYQLFGRVLPHCLGAKNTPLQEYRNHISLYHLVAYVWETLITSYSLNIPVHVAFQYATPLSDTPWYRLLAQHNTKQALQPLYAQELLAAIDSEEIKVEPQEDLTDEYQLSTTVERNQFLQICFMACFQSTSQMTLTLTSESKKQMPDIPLYLFDKTTESLNHLRFISEDTTINPGHFPPLVRLSNAAARNRLLQTQYKTPLAQLNLDRWQEAGHLIYSLFTQHAEDFKPQALENYLQLEASWREDWFNPNHAPQNDSFEWKLAQFAQMGQLGVEAFFDYLTEHYLKKWDTIYQTPKLNIPVLFDLNGDRLISATQYIAYLREELINFITDKRCTPKFGAVHLILPNSLKPNTIKEITLLIKAINKNKYAQYNEVDSLYFYDLKNRSEAELDDWFNELDSLAARENKPLMTLIRIPELDNQVSTDPKENALKTRYRVLQNKILDNQRVFKEKQLEENTALFYKGAEGDLDPMVDIRSTKHRTQQPFTGKDETYLLAAHTPGIQQELQQNVEARHEIAQQVEERKVQYEELIPEIKGYKNDLTRLITRHNIQDRLSDSKETIDWNKEFSLWVGSKQDAAYLISYIEPEALEQIRAFRGFFQMGIEHNHLPFGFYLSHHPQSADAYILCYDANRATKERGEWEHKSLELRNPFIAQLDTKAKAFDFDGDFRQLRATEGDEQAQVSLWYYLATRSINATQQAQQCDALRQVARKHFVPQRSSIPVLMSRYEVSGKTDEPSTLQQIQEYLGNWAQSVLGAKSNPFVLSFIKSMNEAQLKSFGQLCYHYDSRDRELGSHHFLRIAYQMYQTFGAHHFTTWQKAIFANSQNASELLEQSVLDAMGLSLITLKDKDIAYTNIWFQLLAAQANNTGMIHYARLWYAYQTLLSLIDKKQLVISNALVEKLIKNSDSFQSLVWIDRLHQCLKKMEGQLYEKDAQQALLDNLDKVDWQRSGLIYAMTHNDLPYWSSDLALQQLEYASSEGYEPLWDTPIESKALSLQFGRYLAGSLQVHFKEYQHYKDHIKPLIDNQCSYALARLLLIHLDFGSETLTEWSEAQCELILAELNQASMNKAVHWINEAFKLDQYVSLPSYRPLLTHLPLICRALTQYDLANLDALGPKKRIALLNALGKTCEYQKESVDHNRLAQMIKNALSDSSYLIAMEITPWLINQKKTTFEAWPYTTKKDHYDQQNSLLKQLASISYATSTWLPEREQIVNALLLIEQSESPDDTRRHIIGNWVNKGCAIIEQDGTFRELTPKEQEQLTAQSMEQFLPQHAKDNTLLISQLIPHLAIEANLVNTVKAFTHLVAQLKRIDNKPHFNDLGVVLGSLIQHVQKQAPCKMSLQQLSEILDSLMLATHGEMDHFSADMLLEVVSQAGARLTSKSLNNLSTNLAFSFHKQVIEIVNADIANSVKVLILRLVPKGLSEQQLDFILNHFVVYKLEGVSLEYQMELAKALILVPQAASELMDTLLYLAEDDPLWLKGRQQLLERVNKAGSIALIQSLKPVLYSNTQPIPEIELIALSSGASQVNELKQLLLTLSEGELKLLAEYCAHPPIPSAEYLMNHLTQYSVEQLIHRFETIDQAQNLRHYSVTESEKEDLKRILGGIKEKNSGYITDDKQKQVMGLLYYLNAYAQEQDLANVTSAEIKDKLRQTAQWMQATEDESLRVNYSMQLLAMLREVLLRKTGKWANHTQMIALIYAALHNSESIFHQVKTGQGKSIITIMRVAFHALNGKVVDVFTAKESLSSRDHEEFGHILDAIGIEHNHIIPNSDELDYALGDEVFGAVNYMTPGSFSLYQSGHCWTESSKRYINYHSKERVAFFDEGDHVLLDEQTMFNFSYGGESGKLYNYDAWVYQATWEYFQTIKDKLPKNEKNIPYISRQKHLSELCQFLQKRGDLAPIQSTFIQHYLAPVLDDQVKDKSAAIFERDKMLSNLLAAAYTASNLEENKDFCVHSSSSILANGVTIQSRVAKVVINNQVQEGATYSERVHQFLHVILNQKALAKGEQPNFFIAPDSSIVLSQNVPALIRHYYSQIEGCSGTMGDAGDRQVYQERFGIHHIIKLPTHEVSQTRFEGTIFCEGQEDYVQTISRYLMANQHRPILLVSEDDVAVKSISTRLSKVLPKPVADRLICDTNDSGVSEKEILPRAGKAGAIVSSARMARGTDIKPETEEGLFVIRAYPDMPRFAKQSGGRQGRNGAKGGVIDIIDFALIRKEYLAFNISTHASRLAELMQRERQHLDSKCAKHQRLGSHKWDWLINDHDKQEKYLQTRVVGYLKNEIKINREYNIRCKEALVSECSSHVMAQLMHQLGEDQSVMRTLRKDWLRAREHIESAWQQRMNGALEDNEAVFDAFYEKAQQIWHSFAAEYPDYIDATLLDAKEELLHSVKQMKKVVWNAGEDKLTTPDVTQKADMNEVIHYYQQWLKQVGPQVLATHTKTQQQLFYGKPHQGLNHLDGFYQALVKASQEKEADEGISVTQNTQALFAQLSHLPFPNSTYVPLVYMSDVVSSFDGERHKAQFVDKLKCLKQFFNHPCAAVVPRLTHHHMTTLGESAQLLMRLACQGFVSKDNDHYRHFSTQQTVQAISDILWQSHWSTINPKQFAALDRFLNQEPEVARLFTTQFSALHWKKLISQLIRYDMDNPEEVNYLNAVVNYFKTHSEVLNNSHANALDALTDLFFYYPHRRIDATQMPKPDCLAHVKPEDSVRFIHYLAEQFMISEHDINQLTTMLNELFTEDKSLIEEIMPRLTSLPANIPMSMISSRLERFATNRNLRGFKHSIEALTKVGNALNEFTNKMLITTPENSLPSEGAQEQLLSRAQQFILDKEEEDKLHEAAFVLNELAAKYTDADTCLMALEQFGSEYRTALKLLSQAKAALTGEAYEDFYEACFMDDKQADHLSLLTKIVSLFETYANTFATDEVERQKQQVKLLMDCLDSGNTDLAINKLKKLKSQNITLNEALVWNSWDAEIDELGEQIKLIKEINNLEPTLKSEFLTLLKQDADKNRLITFLHLMQKDSKTEDALSTNQLLYILQQWQDKKIQDGSHLKKVFEAQKLANVLMTETDEQVQQRQFQGTPTMDKLFATCDKNHNNAQRFNLMHSITHALISVTEELFRQCWKFYQRFISQIGDIKKQIDAVPEHKKSQALTPILRSVKGLTMELYLVASPEPSTVTSDKAVHYYDQLITSFERQYTGDWKNYFSINKKRWSQAQSLFGELKQIANPVTNAQTMAEFYSAMLEVIDKTQKDIINNDAQYKIGNKKGYSRLLDITQQLGLQVCKDLIAEPSLSKKDKQKAHDWLIGQEKDLVHQLWQRLPKNHPSVPELEPFARNTKAPDPAAVDRCKAAISQLQEIDLPKEVRYLLPLLKGHFDVTEAAHSPNKSMR